MDMGEEIINIEIGENGEVFIETNGIKGPACIDEVEKLLKELVFVTDMNKSDEYFMENSAGITLKNTVKRNQR